MGIFEDDTIFLTLFFLKEIPDPLFSERNSVLDRFCESEVHLCSVVSYPLRPWNKMDFEHE